MSTWVLKFISGKYQGQEFALQEGQDYTVGRSSDSSLILVEDMVSRNHARIFITPQGGVRMEDLGSTNGSFVNGERVRDSDVKEGDRILFGTSIIKLVRLDEDAAETGTVPRVDPPVPPPRPGPASGDGGGPATMAMQAIPSPEMMARLAAGEPLDGLDGLGGTAPPAAAAPPVASAPQHDLGTQPPSIPPANYVSGPQTHTSRPTVAGAISGLLEEVALADLLQLFSTSRKSGVLRIEGPNAGAIHLREGRIVYTEIQGKPNLHPEKATYRILTWNSGTFVLEPVEEREFPETLDYGTEGLLMESMRLLDEMENLRGKLDMHARVGIRSPVVPPLRSLTPELLDTLQLVLNVGVVEQILDGSLATDLETMQDLGYLVKHGYIEVLQA